MTVKNCLKTYKAKDLTLGFHGNSCDFDWRPFDQRSPEAQKAYLRLKEDIQENGVLHPLITFKGHVLVGMRRFEIWMDLYPDPEQEFQCVEILEDVSNWTGKDIDRFYEFKDEVCPPAAGLQT